jgi:hypothetical protein
VLSRCLPLAVFAHILPSVLTNGICNKVLFLCCCYVHKKYSYFVCWWLLMSILLLVFLLYRILGGLKQKGIGFLVSINAKSHCALRKAVKCTNAPGMISCGTYSLFAIRYISGEASQYLSRLKPLATCHKSSC